MRTTCSTGRPVGDSTHCTRTTDMTAPAYTVPLACLLVLIAAAYWFVRHRVSKNETKQREEGDSGGGDAITTTTPAPELSVDSPGVGKDIQAAQPPASPPTALPSRANSRTPPAVDDCNGLLRGQIATYNDLLCEIEGDVRLPSPWIEGAEAVVSVRLLGGASGTMVRRWGY